jgi:hypothetical protein
MMQPHTRAALSGPIIPLVPAFADLTGDLVSAILLRQLIYWHSEALSKKPGAEWMPLPSDLVSQTLRLTRSQRESARARLVQLGIVVEERQGWPANLYVRIDYDRLEELLSQLLTDFPAGTKVPDGTQFAEILQTDDSCLQDFRKVENLQTENRSRPPVLSTNAPVCRIPTKWKSCKLNNVVLERF